MPNERARRGDFLAAAEHIRKLMVVIDAIDELIECGWLSKEQACADPGNPGVPRPVLARREPAGLHAPGHRQLAVDHLRRRQSSCRHPGGSSHRESSGSAGARTAPASDQQKLETAVGHINILLDIIRGVDEGDECKQIVLRHGEDIAEAMHFVRAHTRPEPVDEQPCSIVGFPSVDELIAYLRNKPEQPDKSTDYGDETRTGSFPDHERTAHETSTS